jgi:thymidylate kinase
MATIHERLEELFTKVLSLPEPLQETVAEALAEMTSDEPYQLSDDELAILIPALARAEHGEFVDDDDIDAILNQPWTKSQSR